MNTASQHDHDALIDLGPVVEETKGPPSGDSYDNGLPRRASGAGLSND